MPLKPTKQSFKVWIRADSPTGYFCEFSMYDGQSESTDDSIYAGLHIWLKFDQSKM